MRKGYIKALEEYHHKMKTMEVRLITMQANMHQEFQAKDGSAQMADMDQWKNKIGRAVGFLRLAQAELLPENGHGRP